MRSLASRALVPIAILLPAVAVAGYEFTSEETEFSVGGVVSGAVQCDEEQCEAALPLQPELHLRLDGNHAFQVKLGLASGSALNLDSPFNIAPWAADLETDVENINGSSRSHLLTAWYQYTARLATGGSLEASVGILDATDYLDDNAYSNDEYTQFMNSALVNGPNVFLPSYEAGFALGWTGDHWSARGVYMHADRNDDGNTFHFLGAQVGYRADTALGEGNYRLLVDATDNRFYDSHSASLESRAAVLLSCDQQLGKVAGAFVRFGRQTDDAAIDYAYLYSGGIDLRGSAWGRERDNIGVGYAYLAGGNGDLQRSRVLESYYRFALNATLSMTGDLQYMADERRKGPSPAGFVLGLRITAEF